MKSEAPKTGPQGIRPDIALLPFQQEIVDAVHSGKYPEVLFSAGRGQGKTFISSQLVADLIWYKSPLYEKGKEVIVVASTLAQAGTLFHELQWMRDCEEYQISDTINQKQILHKKDRTACRVISSNAVGALGLGANQSLIIADEIGAWESRGGNLMAEALLGALGKPGSTMRILWVGTVAPAKNAFWERKVNEAAEASESDGCKSFVYKLDAKDEDDWDNVDRVLELNPLKAAFDDSRAFLLKELEAAKADYGKRIYFLNWLLNYSTGSERHLLLTAPQIKTLFENEVPPREGEYVLGLDIGDNQAFSAAAAVWQNGRVEGFAACSGIPSIRERERNDAKAEGTYKRLVDLDLLHTVPDKHTVPLEWFLDLIKIKLQKEPFLVAADQFRYRELKDVCDWSLEYRRTTTAENANFGIEAFRQYASDGGISIAKECQPIFALSFADARVETDGAGLSRTVKKSADNTGRDDLAHALILACDLYKSEFDLKGGTPAVFSLG